MNNFVFKKSLKSFKNKKNIFLNSFTSGQASTVKKAINYLNDKNKIIIHSCDLTFNVNMDEVNYKIKKFDVLIFTAKSTKYNFKNSNQFSWVRKNKKKDIEISLKKNFIRLSIITGAWNHLYLRKKDPR